MAIKLKRKKNIVKGNPNIKDRTHAGPGKRNIKGNPDIKDSRYERSAITGEKRSLTAESQRGDEIYKAIEKKRMKKKGRLVSKY
jgi:hypothetical protein